MNIDQRENMAFHLIDLFVEGEISKKVLLDLLDWLSSPR